VHDALLRLQELPVQDMGFARLDTHRELRQGLPEVIYAEGKTPGQVVGIAAKMLETGDAPVLATRVSAETANALLSRFPDATHREAARLVIVRSEPAGAQVGDITVVSAGTSDLPVAEEAIFTAEAFGARVHHVTDAGVAGLHRLLAEQHRLHDSDVVIAVAGMEGALASLVGGISSAPVVAVPTSVGYGAAFEGLAALLAMLNACATGIVVTNIDNGFGAAMFALRLLRKIRKD
jgi:pyridinium-3,5-biscarboxylic acid mononucleotide synthase